MEHTTSIITRCPQCATAFRASTEVLNIAKGNVRCGSCLTVFNAAEHNTEMQKKSASQTHATSTTEPPQSNNWFRLKKPEKKENIYEPSLDDEQWAIELLKQEEKREQEEKELSEREARRAIFSLQPAAPFDADSDATSHFFKLSTSHKLEKETNKEYLANISPAKVTNDQQDDISEKAADNDALFIDIINNDLDAKTSDTPQERSDHNIDQNTESINHKENTRSKSLEDDYYKEDKTTPHGLDLYEEQTPKRWPWFLGTAFMCTLLFLQIAWLRFDELSIQPNYRHYYAIACQWLDCELPLRSDLKKIRTTHFIVRSHPDTRNALVADIILHNYADFDQRYPALQLSFLNIHGETVASRAFRPSEYLKGELINAEVMPAEQAIQLSLAFVDPGESAINYQVDVVATP